MSRPAKPGKKPAKSQVGQSLRSAQELPVVTLGRRRDQPFTYTPELLEAVPLATGRAFPGQSLWVALDCERFTSLCPITGQPDWARLVIAYLPDRLLVESKSLKEYLTSFRQHGDFHEDVCRIIAGDLVRLLSPNYLEITGRFDSRGSIAIRPFVQYAKPGDAAMEQLRDQRRSAFDPGA